jgi:hypothetical protein
MQGNAIISTTFNPNAIISTTFNILKTSWHFSFRFRCGNLENARLYLTLTFIVLTDCWEENDCADCLKVVELSSLDMLEYPDWSVDDWVVADWEVVEWAVVERPVVWEDEKDSSESMVDESSSWIKAIFFNSFTVTFQPIKNDLFFYGKMCCNTH